MHALSTMCCLPHTELWLRRFAFGSDFTWQLDNAHIHAKCRLSPVAWVLCVAGLGLVLFSMLLDCCYCFELAKMMIAEAKSDYKK